MTTSSTQLSSPTSKAGRLQRALLERLQAHEADGMLPTSGRFLYYELIMGGVVSKVRTGARRTDQDPGDALTRLREIGMVPWEWIIDETRELTEWATAPTVADYIRDQVKFARLNPWGDEPAPLILCESRSLAGVLERTAARYACPIASTNGQTRGFLIREVAPRLVPGQRVLWVGDFDHSGPQIEAASRRTLIEHSLAWGRLERRLEQSCGVGMWERIALTQEQVDEFDLPVISKPDRRYRPVQYFDAVEAEALGQGRIVKLVTARLDELMPEPIEDVLEREAEEQRIVVEQLRNIG